MDDKIISLDSKKRELQQKKRELQQKEEDTIRVLSLGCIHLDLSISIDGNSLFFTPSYELEDGISNEMMENISNMLKKGFPEAITQLLELYKSGK